MSRRCSHCSHIGHNSRTCTNRGVKLFGVQLTDGSIRKSASMGNLTNFPGLNQLGSSNPGSPGDTPDNAAPDGYASEDFVPGSSSTFRERKKCTPCRWTEEEHRLFLLGLQKHRRGDWRGIARNYVVSRTPSQVASHAQKYFIRQTNDPWLKRRTSVFDIVADEVCRQTNDPWLKRRTSVFDIVANEVADALMAEQDFLPANQPQPETEGNNPLPNPSTLDKEVHVSMDSVHADDGESASLKLDSLQSSYPAVCTPYFYPPLPQPYWPGYNPDPTKKGAHKVVKPTPVHLKSPINVDELVGMSNLSLGDSIGDSGTSSLSLKLLEGPSRQSAFHATPRRRSSDANGSGVNPV